jgi:hypothetical protein
VTVVPSPTQADLLARTGRAWPDADEDRLVAMAAGWRTLGARLDVAQRDHDGLVRSIRARYSSTGVAAFGEWVTRFDESILRFLEICGAAEAALMRAAHTVLTAKNTILGALTDLAAWLDGAERRGAVGGAEPLVDAARERISVALEDVTRQLDDDILPALGVLVERDRSLVRELEALLAPLERAGRPSR